MRHSRTLANIIVVITLGLFACQVDNPTAPDAEDPAFGMSGGGGDGHDRDRGHDRWRWRCYDDERDGHDKKGGHDGHGEYDGHDKNKGHGENDGPQLGKSGKDGHDRERDRHCKPKKDRKGILTVIKNSDAPGTFEFEGTPYLETFVLVTDETGTAQVTFEDVHTMPDYNIFETPHPDFVFVGATCTLEDGEATGYTAENGVTDVRIEHGKVTTCVFENEKIVTATGALNVVKTSDVAGSFNFEGTPTIGSFSIATVDATPVAQLFEGLDATVTYSITEVLDPGFDLTGAACVLEDGTATGVAGASGISEIVVQDGQTTTCSFANTARVPEVGSLIVVKTSDNPGVFDFTGSDPIGTFQLDTGDPATSSQLFENLDVAAVYDVSEAPHTAFELVAASCSLADGTATGTSNATGVTGITIVAGETTTCTFDNATIQTPVGSLTIVKTADGAGTFTFTGTDPIGTFTLDTGDPATATQTFGGLETALTYDITEGTVDPGFEFVTASCSLEDGTATGTLVGTGVTGIAIAEGQTTTCTFENAVVAPPTGSLRIVKQSDEFGVFVFDGSPDIGLFTLATDDPAFSEVTFTDLLVETLYTITETANPDFELTSVSCALEDGTATGVAGPLGISEVALQENSTTTCTFVNAFIQPVGFLRVVMETDAPGSFNFEGTPSIGTFVLNTADAATSEQTFEITDFAATYTLTQTENPAFDFTSAVCVLEDGTETGTVAAFVVSGILVNLGQTTTCTFVNTTRPVGPPSGPPISIN